MRALFVGPGGSFVTTCGNLLMLCDNVQHHLEAGRVAGDYFWIHELADAVAVRERVSAPARELGTELARAFVGIQAILIRDLAISIRTHALLSGLDRFPLIRGTVLVRLTRWRIPLPTWGVSTLGDLFADFRSEVERVTIFGKARGRVEASWQPTLLLVHGGRESSAVRSAGAGRSS